MRQQSSISDIIQQRQVFVGRTGELASFRDNLTAEPEDRYFVFALHGDGGVGKTSLARRMLATARQAGARCAYLSDNILDTVGVMKKITDELRAEKEFETFLDRHRTYVRKRQELEADPEAPQHGATAFFTRTAGRIALSFVPGGAIVADPVADAVADHVSTWSAFVRRKLRERGDAALILSPVETLSPHFVTGLSALAASTPVVLCFDTYERTSPYLDSWLRELLGGQHGPPPLNLTVVVAGRHRLAANDWSDYMSVVQEVPVRPFTLDEVRSYLQRSKGGDPAEAEQVLARSGGMPLWVAVDVVGSGRPQPGQGDPSSTLVDRFLRWEDDPRRHRWAVDSSLPRLFNKDVLTVVHGEEQPAEILAWLRSMPFVADHPGGWQYHQEVRRHMLRLKRRESPSEWTRIHLALAERNAARRAELPVDTGWAWGNETWARHMRDEIYHRLCADPGAGVVRALEQIAATWGLSAVASASFGGQAPLRQWGDAFLEAAEDAQSPTVAEWGRRLRDAESSDATSLDLLTAMLDHPGLSDAARAQVAMARAYHFQGQGYASRAIDDAERAVRLCPDDLGLRGERGVVYREFELYDKALADFDAVLAEHPDNDVRLASRGETLRLMGRPADGLADLDRSLAQVPDDTWTLQSRGLAYFDLGRVEDALADLVRATRLEPDEAGGYLTLADVYVRTRRFGPAFAALDKAVALAPDAAITWENRSAAHLAAGDLAAAVADLDKAVEVAPRRLRSLLLRADAHLEADDFAAALADADRATALDPTNATAQLTRSGALRLVGRTDEALAALDAAAHDLPPATVAVNRGLAMMAAGALDAAFAELDRAVALEPDFTWARVVRAESYLNVGRAEEALADADAVLAVQPGDAAALVARASAVGLLGRIDEALADFARALAAGAREGSVRFARGQVLEANDRHDEALADFEHILRERPSSVDARRSRSRILYAGQRYEEAVEEWTALLATAPNDVDALANRGLAAWSSGLADEALADWGRALELDPADAWVRLQRARLLWQLDRNEEAVADADLLIAAAPGNGEARFLRAEALRDLGRDADVARAYDDALAAGIPAHEVHLRRAESLRRVGDLAGALADLVQAARERPEETWIRLEAGHLRRQLDRDEETIADADAVLAAEPGNLDARLLRADALVALGRAEEAIAEYGVAVDAGADGEEVFQMLLARDAAAAVAFWDRHCDPGRRRVRAGLLMSYGHPDLALADLDEATVARAEAAGPADGADVHAERARALEALGRLDEAAQEHGRAYGIQVDDWHLRRRAWIRERQGRWSGALADWDLVVAGAPDDFDARANRASARVECGDFEGAREDYAAVVRAEPEWTWVVSRYADVLTWLGEPAAAVAAVEEVLAHSPNDVTLTAKRAETSLLLPAAPDPAATLAAIDAVVTERDGGDGWWLMVRGLARGRLGDTAAAAADFTAAARSGAERLALEPGDAQLTANLAHFELLAGARDEALRRYEQLLAAGPRRGRVRVAACELDVFTTVLGQVPGAAAASALLRAHLDR
ncbi:tetratricopeptide repeat protein [Phytohabitans suffuscus]|uniref:Orc1-like AAA ATPase domain-containing protein n=1 Tax=Phytohabitans suffuscus TaxID=624315 RepID=A0A6F8YXB0_9ACTN|nr:tetratricopeptide repeat protein [Phytohabitans suffuscus]BCB90578.1 hypothetical protein Psuf_078910 [Phytohabitans suffuscus]